MTGYGTTVERGVLPDKRPYRIWRHPSGKLYGFVEVRPGDERRRSVRNIRKMLRSGAEVQP